jgi:3-hydroxyisobutyrate dehydrogenase-like beta-hydroxyacid dehydrogenase
MKRTIGYVGLGNIGGAMAVRLAEHDHHLVVYDLVKERMDRLSNYGAESAQSPADVASRTEIVYCPCRRRSRCGRSASGPTG